MHDIRKRFGATVALAGVSLQVKPGEVLALVGQNGAGKSTLMKVLSGALRPDGGHMALDGVAYTPRGPLDARRLGVAMIYQELALAPHLSVAENILLGMEKSAAGVLQWREMRRTAREALAELGHAELDVDRTVEGLSPATQQVIEIARALAVGCKVLVLDEPTSSLTRADVERLFGVIRTLRARGLAIVYISHFLEEVKAIADRFVVLRDGATVGSGDVGATSTGQIVELMVGKTVQDLYPRTARKAGEVVLSVRDLSGRSKPLGASLELHRGEVLGIAGLIGAGRTELLRAIFGLDVVRRGEVRTGHVQFSRRLPAQRWRAGLGMLSEDRKNEGLALTMSIADNLTLSDFSPFGRFGFIRPRDQRMAANMWADALQLKRHSVTQTVGELSGGNQQKVAIARLLHHDVDVLLLDEPTRGIDVGSKATIYRLIDELATGKHGKPRAVLMVSSYFPELLGVCDRIAVMSRGILGDARPVSAWTEQGLMLEATGTAAESSAA